jgi:hypothetical protein
LVQIAVRGINRSVRSFLYPVANAVSSFIHDQATAPVPD